MTTALANLGLNCFQCGLSIMEGDVFETVMDGHLLAVHTECPKIIEPEPADNFVPPFLKVVKIIFDFIGKPV